MKYLLHLVLTALLLAVAGAEPASVTIDGLSIGLTATECDSIQYDRHHSLPRTHLWEPNVSYYGKEGLSLSTVATYDSKGRVIELIGVPLVVDDVRFESGAEMAEVIDYLGDPDAKEVTYSDFSALLDESSFEELRRSDLLSGDSPKHVIVQTHLVYRALGLKLIFSYYGARGPELKSAVLKARVPE